jgi:hypothetical protein
MKSSIVPEILFHFVSSPNKLYDIWGLASPIFNSAQTTKSATRNTSLSPFQTKAFKHSG